jgi:dienelactone hydrolase
MAQKPVIDTGDIAKWYRMSAEAISGDGKYMSYVTENLPFGSRTLHIQGIGNDWSWSCVGGSEAKFTIDGRSLLFLRNDSLYEMPLGKGAPHPLAKTGAYRLFQRSKEEYLVYNNDKELVISCRTNGRQRRFTDIEASCFNEKNDAVVLDRKTAPRLQSLSWVNLPSGTEQRIWEGSNYSDCTIAEKGDKLAFIVSDTTTPDPHKAVWYFSKGMEKAASLMTDVEIRKGKDLLLDGIKGFSNDGTGILVMMKEKPFPTPAEDAVKMDLYSYRDTKLQSLQLSDLKPGIWGDGGPRKYLTVIDIPGRKAIQLQQGDEKMWLFDNADSFGIAYSREGSDLEDRWNKASGFRSWLVDMHTGAHTEFPLNVYPSLSPDKRYLLCNGKDDTFTDLYSYEIATGTTRDISKDLPIPALSDNNNGGISGNGIFLAAWMKGCKDILLYDDYDIWKVSVSGGHPPVCLTNGYGRKHGISFRFTDDVENRELPDGGSYLLSAFDKGTKDNGFYRMKLGAPADPDILTMGPYIYDIKGSAQANEFALPNVPVKAKNADVWLVVRESADAAPNVYWTKDFRSLHVISDVHPEKAFNWLTSELINFKRLDGSAGQGVLFRPENFDSSRTYPLLIHYYERMSDRKNAFETPGMIWDNINIPWFVSHGYLVFTADIHYNIGALGESITNAIVGAAMDLSKRFRYIDARRMGIQGHSFGGFETNYLITHTDIFAAAMASSGFSDLVSGYGALTYGDGSPFFGMWSERGQGRLGKTLWEDPSLYIANSPVLRADKVTTPVLFMNNKEDGIVNFSQGVEFFTALRRLGRRAWMFQYDGAGHSIIGDAQTKLHTIRVTQFFDHYLKDIPPPRWMTRGIPAKMKGIDMGLAPDTEMKTPGGGLLITK